MENNDIQFTSLQMRTDKYGWASIQYTNKKQAILYTRNGGVEWDVVNPLNSIVLFGYPINARSSWAYGLTKRMTIYCQLYFIQLIEEKDGVSLFYRLKKIGRNRLMFKFNCMLRIWIVYGLYYLESLHQINLNIIYTI